MSAYADEALQLAATAQQSAQSGEALTESDLQALESRVASMQNSLHVPLGQERSGTRSAALPQSVCASG